MTPQEFKYLVYTTELYEFNSRLSQFNEFDLTQVYVEIQKLFGHLKIATPKCLEIIKWVDNRSLLKELVVYSKSNLCVGQAIIKIDDPLILNQIKDIRPELSVHVESRKRFLPNTLRFIIE